MPETPVVPFLPRSTLFIAGMIGKCPCLQVIMAHAMKEEQVPPNRRSVIIEKLFRSLPALPPLEDAAEIAILAALPADRVAKLADRHHGTGGARLTAVWERTASELENGAERDFARRCGTLLTELYRRRDQRSGTRPSSRKNA